MRLLNRSQLTGENKVVVLPTTLSLLPITLLHIIHHVGQRRSGEKYLIDPAPFHLFRVIVGNGAAATPENGNIPGSLFTELSNDLREKLNMTAVVTGNADRR